MMRTLGVMVSMALVSYYLQLQTGLGIAKPTASSLISKKKTTDFSNCRIIAINLYFFLYQPSHEGFHW